MSRRRADDAMEATPAAAGKVVWANEGFERLAGVDTIDFVGRQLGSLLDLFGVEQGDELAQSFELGTVRFGHKAHTAAVFFLCVIVLLLLLLLLLLLFFPGCCFCTKSCVARQHHLLFVVVIGCLEI